MMRSLAFLFAFSPCLGQDLFLAPKPSASNQTLGSSAKDIAEQANALFAKDDDGVNFRIVHADLSAIDKDRSNKTNFAPRRRSAPAYVKWAYDLTADSGSGPVGFRCSNWVPGLDHGGKTVAVGGTETFVRFPEHPCQAMRLSCYLSADGKYLQAQAKWGNGMTDIFKKTATGGCSKGTSKMWDRKSYVQCCMGV